MASVPAQMLNCCIERKRARDEAHKLLEGSKERDHLVSGGGQSAQPESSTAATAATSTREGVSAGKSWDSWSDSEDEFFECLSDQGEIEAPHSEEDKSGRKNKAEGRLHPYNNMTLLNSEEPLYVPVTQVRIALCVSFSLTDFNTHWINFCLSFCDF